MIKERLIALADKGYKDFQSPHIPTVPSEKIIGVRIQVLRALAKELYGSEEAESFISELPHETYEEDNLHAFLVEKISDLDAAIYETERFLPYIDNWATCDSFNPKVFARYPEKLLPKIREWIISDHEYTVRYAIKLLMTYFLDERFDTALMDLVASVNREEYYIRMMVAWYFATALSKQYESAVKIFKDRILPVWVHNKSITKATESFRVDSETKRYLKTLKIPLYK